MTHNEMEELFKQIDVVVELSKDLMDKLELPLIIINRLNINLNKYVQFKKDYLNYEEEAQEELEDIFTQLDYNFNILLPETIQYLEDDIPLIKDTSMNNFNNILGVKSPLTFKNVSCKEIKGVEILCHHKNIFNEIKKDKSEIYETYVPIFGTYLYTGKFDNIEIKRVMFEDDSIWNAPLNLEII